MNPATGQIAAIIPTDIEPCGQLAIARTAVWVSSCLNNSVIARIDPATNRLRSLLRLGNVIQPAADGETVWLVGGGDGNADPSQIAYLLQLRANDTVQRRFRVGAGFVSGGAAVAFGSIWISDFMKPGVLRIPLPC